MIFIKKQKVTLVLNGILSTFYHSSFIETRAILNLSLITYLYFPLALPRPRVNKLVYV
jgi:hypothetical protein